MTYRVELTRGDFHSRFPLELRLFMVCWMDGCWLLVRWVYLINCPECPLSISPPFSLCLSLYRSPPSLSLYLSLSRDVLTPCCCCYCGVGRGGGGRGGRGMGVGGWFLSSGFGSLIFSAGGCGGGGDGGGGGWVCAEAGEDVWMCLARNCIVEVAR